MNRNEIQTLRDAARILGANGRRAAADECTGLAAVLTVENTLGTDPQPAPGKRLERLVPRPGQIAGAL